MKICIMAKPRALLPRADDAITIDASPPARVKARLVLGHHILVFPTYIYICILALTSVGSMLRQHYSTTNSEEAITDNKDTTSNITDIDMALSQRCPTGPVVDEFSKSLQRYVLLHLTHGFTPRS